jgi:hypothetical protein
MLQKGEVIEKVEVTADCFGDGQKTVHTAFSISHRADISAFALIVTNEKSKCNEVVSTCPIVRNGKKIKLRITDIKEWSNGVEAVIEGETESEHTISFFDTQYFKNKNKYKIGRIYAFTISALSYNVGILQEKSFSFEGQKAVDLLAKIHKQPTYDALGNIEPVVFDLSNLVTYLPRNEYPDDAEFQSPINDVEVVNAFDNEFYKFNITIFRDPDICIDLYAKTRFFEQRPKINEPLRGVLWIQGYWDEENAAKQSGLLNSDGEPTIFN